MDIDRLSQIEISDFDKIEMIISNNINLMYKGKSCVTIDNWDKLTNEILLWHKSKVKNLSLYGVRHPFPTKQEAEIELRTMLAEIEKNTKESYLKRTILKGIEIGFKKGYNYMKSNCD